MKWLILCLAGIAIYHFVVEAIIAPSFRMGWRYELFGLRDQLRRLKLEYPTKVSDDVFEIMQRNLNNAITLLHTVNINLLVKMENELASNAELAAQVREQQELIENCQIPEIEKINHQIVMILNRALRINHLGWAIYLFPIIGLWVYANKAVRTIKSALAMPESEIEKISPFTPAIQ